MSARHPLDDAETRRHWLAWADRALTIDDAPEAYALTRRLLADAPELVAEGWPVVLDRARRVYA